MTTKGTQAHAAEPNEPQPPFQIYGDVGVSQPVSVYFTSPQPVTAAVTIPQPLQVYGNVDVAQPISVYFTAPQPVTIPEPVSVYGTLALTVPQPPFQVYGNVGIAQPISVYFNTPPIVQVPEPLSVYNATPQPVYESQPVQVYGNVGVAQPVSVYFQTPQSVTESNQPQPPFQVYGSAQGVQVYGNVGVAQPVSVYFTSPNIVQVPQPLAVYSSPSTPAVNVYDIQKFTDPTQVFSGGVGSGAGINLTVVPATANKSFEISIIDVWNVYGSPETVALRWGATGPFRFIKKLPSNVGWNLNFENATWRGPNNTGLNVYTFEPMGGPTGTPGGYVTYTVMGQYNP